MYFPEAKCVLSHCFNGNDQMNSLYPKPSYLCAVFLCSCQLASATLANVYQVLYSRGNWVNSSFGKMPFYLGELQKISLEGKKIMIKCPVHFKTLKCIYFEVFLSPTFPSTNVNPMLPK